MAFIARTRCNTEVNKDRAFFFALVQSASPVHNQTRNRDFILGCPVEAGCGRACFTIFKKIRGLSPPPYQLRVSDTGVEGKRGGGGDGNNYIEPDRQPSLIYSRIRDAMLCVCVCVLL